MDKTLPPPHLHRFLAALVILTLALTVLPISQVFADTLGPNNAGTGANVNGPGTINWTNPGNVTADDTSYATAVLTPNATSEYLQATNYGFSIPSNAIIDGIQVAIMRQSSSNAGGNSVDDSVVRLIKAGVQVGNNLASGTDWPTTFGVAPYGGTSNLWGTTWTPAEINAANFGVALSVENESGGTNRTASVDYIQVTITYTIPAEIDVQGNGVSITDGDTTPNLADHTDFSDVPRNFSVDRTFTILNLDPTNTLNIGTVTFTGGETGDFSLVSAPAATVAPGGSTTFTVRLTAGGGADDNRNTTITFATNDPNENPFNFAVRGTRVTAGIDVQGNGVSINDGDNTPSLTDHTHFGNTSLGTPVTRTYTIENTSGIQTLYLGPVIIGGANAGDFTVTSAPPSTVAPNGTATFTVEFNPSATGIRNATVSFINNDNDESPYNWSIRGTVSPDIDVRGNGLSIPDGDTSPNVPDGTDFGSVAVGDILDHTFTIHNTGSTNLTLSTPTLTGSTLSFTLLTPPALTVLPGGSTSFVIRFSPIATGGPIKDAAVSIANNDPEENPYTFEITGTRPIPEIDIQGNGISIPDGDGTPAFPDGTNWGFVGVGIVVDHTFTIYNTGSANLTLTNARITGATLSFSVLTPPAAVVPSGGSTTVVIRFSPSAAGGATKDAEFLVDNNDPNENPYNFDLQGTRLDAGAEVELQGNGLPITDGDNTPRPEDGTDFGNVNLGSSATRTFTIYNYGASNLTIGTFTFTGDFSLASAPAATVAPGGATTFDVLFTPSGLGVQNGTLSFVNNDTGTENPYNFSLTGTGADQTYPTVTATNPTEGTSFDGTGPTQIVVNFSEDVRNDGSAGAANTVANYLLVEIGANNTFDTLSCAGGRVADDVQIAVNTASYTNNGGSGPFAATLNLNGGIPLPQGSYRLFICGTTSIEDLNGNELNNGSSDATMNFTVVLRTASARTNLPATGFPQGRVTALSAQPAEMAYASYSDLWLEIPKLGLKTSIVGVPQTAEGWNVTWLDRDAGWLNGSAFPTWSGNSVITAHVWDALNQPGPFANLKDLRYGDQIKIHAYGQVYTYEIRESRAVLPTSLSTVFKHEEKSWITLLTCEDFKEKSQTYSHRRMVRAVLVSVTAEK